MKLLMISGDRSLASGKRGAFFNTLSEFHKYWERIDIICPRANTMGTFVITKVPIVLFGNVFIHPSPWPLFFQPLWILHEGLRILRINNYKLGTRNYLITVHEYAPFYNGLGAWLFWRKARLPYVLEIHHITGYPRAADLKERFYRWLTEHFIKYDSRTAQAVRIVNQNQLRKFLGAAGVPADKLIYIPSAYIDLEVFRPLNLEKKYDLIFVGRLEKNKGINLFLKTVKKISAGAVIVGDGSLKRDIKFKIENWKLKVDMYGWVKDSQAVAQLLNQSKLLVMTSYSEGNPRVVLEAMACGVPVLGTPVGIVPDLLAGSQIIDWRPEDIAQKARALLFDHRAYQLARERGLLTVKQFEKTASIKNYAERLKNIGRAKKLLIITQKVSQNDQLLGFFTDWLKQFAGHFQKVLAVCLEKGEYDLPGNVKVIGLGKERGLPKPIRLFNFYRLIWRCRNDYDAVFIHMNPIWMALAGRLWRRWGKRTALWYTSKGVTNKLRRAERWSDVIFTASKESFRLPSKKVIVTGHGINTDFFKPAVGGRSRSEMLRILSVGRIAPVKNYETLVDAAKILAGRGLKFSVTLIGEPALERDKSYELGIKNKIKELNLEHYFNFVGKVNYKDLPRYYQSRDLFVHLSKTGSLDKVLLEAMACGMKVLSSNDAARSFLPPELIFDENNPADLAEKIKQLAATPASGGLRDYVVKNHNLPGLITKISKALIVPFPTYVENGTTLDE